MLKKLIHFASNIIKPGPSSNDLGLSSEEDLEAPRLQSSLEYQPELGNAISPGSDAELAQSSRSDMTSVRRSVSDRDISSQISHLNTEATAIADLDTLYRSLPLDQGMLYIAESLASATEQTYLPKTAQWLGESDFQRLGAIAITAKRQGDYAKAMTIFNEFAQDCPYYYQIHHSTMKILGASGDLEAALKALQLWCVAIIPEKILRLPALNNQLPDGKWPISVEQLTYLAGWAIADTKSMYHLGSLHLMVSDDLSVEVRDTYIASLQGKKQQALHPPKIAIQRGKEVAQALPWDALIPIMNSELWQYLVWRSQQQAQNLKQRRSAVRQKFCRTALSR